MFPSNFKFLEYSTLHARVFKREVFPDPVGPIIAVKRCEKIWPVTFLRIDLASIFFFYIDIFKF